MTANPQAGSVGRHLIVGWPGADWASVQALLRAGQLPNLARLVAGGCSGSLATPPPACHAAAWTTLATGMLADRHGVLADTEIRPDGGGVQQSGKRSWRSPAFWEVLETAGRKTICVAWPATAPAGLWPGQHVDERFMLATGSDFDSWAMPPDVVAPAASREALRELRIHPADGLHSQVAALLPEVDAIELRHDQRPMLLQAALAQVGTVQAVATHLAEGAWDVLCVCHDLLRAVVSGRQSGDDGAGSPYGRMVARAHAFQDLMLGRMIELAGPGVTVMVASAGPCERDNPAGPGFLVAAGLGIGVGVPARAALVDLAPSILARFGLRGETDGRPIAGLFAAEGELVNTTITPKADAVAADLSLVNGLPDTLDMAQATALLESSAESLLNLAEVRMARGLVAEAAETLECLRREQPAQILAMQRLVQCRAMMRDADACESLGQSLLHIVPNNPWGSIAMAASFVLRGDDASAQPHLDRATALAGDDPMVTLRLGGMHLLRGRHAEARRAFEAVLLRAPDLAEASYGLGVALAAMGDFGMAEQCLRDSIARQGRQPLAHLQLAAVLSAQTRFKESLAALDTVQAQHPGLAGAGAVLAEARLGLAQQVAAAAVESWRR